jgi:hypothetical protein
MNRNLTILGLSAVAIAAAVIAWPVLFDPSRESRLPRPPTDSVAAQAYPPPDTPAAPTATPVADSGGYLPPPSNISSQTVTLAGSPYSDVLFPLQAALTSGDAAWPAAMVTERFGNTLFDIAIRDSEGGAYLDAGGTEAVLADFFQQGSRPLIQGYFAGGSDLVPCLTVITHRYTGTVPYPSEDAAYGAPSPTHIPADAAAFKLCRAGAGQWIWENWVHGSYYEIVDAYSGTGDADYFVVRP